MTGLGERMQMAVRVAATASGYDRSRIRQRRSFGLMEKRLDRRRPELLMDI